MLQKNEMYYQGFSKGAAWRRFGARMLDTIFYGFLFYLISIFIGFFIGFFGGEIAQQFLVFCAQINPKLDSILTTILVYLTLIPASYHFFGTTLGKKLLGISVINKNGNSLKFKESAKREILVFFKGVFFIWISIIYQYFAFKKNNILSWDKDLDLIVSYKNYGSLDIFIRTVVTIIIIILLIFLNSLLNYYLDHI